jgi:hypothetical protein
MTTCGPTNCPGACQPLLPKSRLCHAATLVNNARPRSPTASGGAYGCQHECTRAAIYLANTCHTCGSSLIRRCSCCQCTLSQPNTSILSTSCSRAPEPHLCTLKAPAASLSCCHSWSPLSPACPAPGDTCAAAAAGPGRGSSGAHLTPHGKPPGRRPRLLLAVQTDGCLAASPQPRLPPLVAHPAPLDP